MTGATTQSQEIVALLRAAPHISAEGWVCGTTFLQRFIPTYSQRIGELITEGWEIERGRCHGCRGRKHRSPIGRYRFRL